MDGIVTRVLWRPVPGVDVAFLIAWRLDRESRTPSVAIGQNREVPSSLPPTGGADWAGASGLSLSGSLSRPAAQTCLPRDSRRTVVVSAGRLEAVTESFGWVTGSAPISWKNLVRTSAQSASSSHSGIGTTIRGSSWATSAAAFVGLSAPPRGTHTMRSEEHTSELQSLAYL